MILLTLFLFINAVVFGETVVPGNGNLIAVTQIFRHGERTPLKFFKGDPYSSKTYWGGLGIGKLTKNGKRQQYDLGKFTRTKYSDFIPQKYDESFIIARSTLKARNHMSAQCNLYGLFPAIGDQEWLENQDWQPIPVYDVDPKILNSNPNTCRTYYLENQAFFKSKEYLTGTQEYSHVFQYLTNHTGENINDTFQAFTFHETILVEDAVGLKLPAWVKEVYPQPLENLTAFSMKHAFSTAKMQRVTIGAFLNEITTFFDDVISEKTNVKYLMYSGHDANLIALLEVFGQFDTSNRPWFTSSVWIELRRSFEGYYINIWYKNKEKLQQIGVKGCTSDIYNCHFNTFKRILEPVLFNKNDWEKECAFT